ncbi:MAG: transglutaminase family protein, partial [Clostridia bacterium]|nr:transglutaminase family protein [Clostridia bacterium]
MKKLHFTYNMQIDYSNPISKCHFTIKCIPKNTKRQTIENVQIKLSPDVPYSCGTAGLRNTQIYGAASLEHTSSIFSI